MDPKQITTIIICLIMLAVGIFAVATVVQTQENQGVNPQYSGSFSITNPSIDQTCDTGHSDLEDVNVVVWDGTAWVTIDPAFWTYSGTTVTVLSGGL